VGYIWDLNGDVDEVRLIFSRGVQEKAKIEPPTALSQGRAKPGVCSCSKGQWVSAGQN